MSVIELNQPALKRLREAKHALKSEDNAIFFDGYSWIFNSICIDPEGFTASCQDASLDPGRVAANIEATTPNVHERYKALLQKNH